MASRYSSKPSDEGGVAVNPSPWLEQLTAHSSDVKCLRIGKKSCRVFATGGEDRRVNIWSIGKPAPVHSLSGHTSPVECVTFDSSEVFVLAGASTGGIKLWDLEDTKSVRTLSGHRSKCTSLEFHPFGEFFASGSSDSDLKIWDIRKKGCIHTYKGHTRGIRAIRFTPDGRWVVSGGEDNVVKLWDLTAGKLLHDFSFHNGVIQCIDFHPHEFLLATGSSDRTVKFWDLETFELIGSTGPEGLGISSMIFHPDGKTLFYGMGKKLKVYSWEPIRCHDDVDIGWSILGDLCVFEEKLVGCSYHQNSVGAWLVDLKNIKPYASSITDRPTTLAEAAFEPVKNHILSSGGTNFVGIDDGNLDQDCVVKEIILGESPASNIVSQKPPGRVGSVKSKVIPKNTVLRGSKGAFSPNGSQIFETNTSTKNSMSNLASSRDTVSSRNNVGAVKIAGSNSTLKGMPVNNGRISDGLSTHKRTGRNLRGTGVRTINSTVCTPVIILRESPEQQNPSGFLDVSSDTEHNNTVSSKRTHMRRHSFVDDKPDFQFNQSEIGHLHEAEDDLNDSLNSRSMTRPPAGKKSVDVEERHHNNIKDATETFQTVVLLDRSFGSCTERADLQCSTSEASPPVKYVRGVAVQHGRTRSLVASWERMEQSNGSCSTISAVQSSSDSVTQNIEQPTSQRKQTQKSETDKIYDEENYIANALLENRDMFVNILKSRLTKLQMVRHCWEQSGVKGAINSVAKLPDHSVQVDVISVLTEKIDLFNLDLFSCLLPMLAGLLSSKTERHIEVSLDMLLKLIKVFKPLINSTMSATKMVGVDIQAEQRMGCCRQVLSQLERITETLPLLRRNGGSISRRVLELNVLLQA